MKTSATARSRFGIAWLALTLCLALHVVDEALTGFLDVYNPNVRALRARLPFLPIPTFTFGVWLALLVFAVGALAGISVFAFRGARWMVPWAFVFGAIMLLNGLGHLGSSIYFERLMPGAYSSPLLLAGAIFLLTSARRMRAVRLAAA